MYKILDIPCAIGSKVFLIRSAKDGSQWIIEKTVEGIHITDKVARHYRDKPTHYLVVRSDIGHAQHIDMKLIGKTVFFDEYEANKVIEGAI